MRVCIAEMVLDERFHLRVIHYHLHCTVSPFQ